MFLERLRFSSLINISFINSVLTTTYTSGPFIANVIHRYHCCYAKCRPDRFKIIKYTSTAPVFNGWQFTSCMTIKVISKNMCLTEIQLFDLFDKLFIYVNMHGGFKKAVYTCKISLEFAIGLYPV